MKQILNLMVTIILVMGSYTIFPANYSSAEGIETLYTSKNEDVKLVTIPEKVETEVHGPTELNDEQKLLARLVHAEAKGEPYAGKVAVANVVLNRVEHEQFPDTIKEVIYEKNAFAPVQNGSIHEQPSKEAVQAVKEAIATDQENGELLYFYNPETATSDWILNRKVVKTIGNHAFAI